MSSSSFSRYTLTEKVITDRLKKGRGKGSGARYKPWILVSDLSSKGLSVRMRGHKTGRIHHLLSELEAKAFHEFENDGRVLDIREQYPLNRLETRTIAKRLGIYHPFDPKSDVDIVMTTDFLLDLQFDDGAINSVAVSCKYADDTEAIRFREKFEIERIYWNARSVQLVLLDERQVSRDRFNNLQAAHAHHDVDELLAPRPSYFEQGAEAMLEALRCGPPWAEVRQIWDGLAERGTVERRHCSNIFWHLVERGAVKFDLNRPFSARASLSQFQFITEDLNALRG